MPISKPGQAALATEGLPTIATPAELALEMGMAHGAKALVPGYGIYVYDANAQGNGYYEDGFSALTGWTEGGEGSFGLSGGFATPTILHGTANGSWYGPWLLRDLGTAQASLYASMRVDLLNSNNGRIARMALDFLDAAGAIIASVNIHSENAPAETRFRVLLGANASLTGTGTPSQDILYSSTAPNAYTGWLGIEKIGDAFRFFWRDAQVWTTTIAGAAAVRYVRLRCQAYRASGVNYSYFSTGRIDAFRLALAPANGASAARAVASGNSSGNTPANSADGSLTTKWGSSVVGAGNHYTTWLAQDLGTGVTGRPIAIEVVNPSSGGGGAGNHATGLQAELASDPAGPWSFAWYAGAVSAGYSSVARLELPVGASPSRLARVTPTTGLSLEWFVGEMRVFYAPAPISTDVAIQPTYALGLWQMAVPAANSLGGTSEPDELLLEELARSLYPRSKPRPLLPEVRSLSFLATSIAANTTATFDIPFPGVQAGVTPAGVCVPEALPAGLALAWWGPVAPGVVRVAIRNTTGSSISTGAFAVIVTAWL